MTKLISRTLLAAASAALLSAVPAAATEWFYNLTPIPQGQTVEVAASAPKADVHIKLPGQTAVSVTCDLTGTEAFWNEGSVGRDETRTAAFACPEGWSVTPTLPWESQLIEGEPPLLDMLEGAAIDVVHNGVDYGVFAGTIKTTAGDIDPLKEREEKPHDEADSFLTFRGSGTVFPLVTASGGKLWLSGVYHLGTNESTITDETGAWK